MNFIEPFDVFFGATALFATSATYKATTTVTGVFWNTSAEEYGVETRAPRFRTKASNFTGLAKGDALVIGSTSYKIQDWEFDGTGDVVELDLERQ